MAKKIVDDIVKNLPNSPGIYQYFDKDETIIYVGKAKDLKKRVSSYFSDKTSHSGKLRMLVSKIVDIKYIVTHTEFDALLLENSLIKKYRPRYNVLLKDDKTYPWIVIKNEPFPRVFPTRHRILDGSEYFGPYASVRMMHTLLDLIRALYPLRTCTLNLTEANIKAKKFKVCLEYHIGNCKAPCESLQTSDEYMATLAEIRSIIKGNIVSVRQQLNMLMQKHAKNLEFEKAQVLKEKLELLDRYQSKSIIVSPNVHNVDVFSYCEDISSGYVNFMKVVNGSIIQSHTVELKKKLDETPQELLSLAVIELRQRFESDSREVILPFSLDIELSDLEITIPQRGDKKQLLELSERNAKFYQLEKHKRVEQTDPERHVQRVLSQFQSDLRLKELPVRIDCFDNSNIQGAYPVSAMVVFTNGKPNKKEYRHFNIKTVEGPNDFASMEEVILRRYERVLNENIPLPQLIVIDGGKGQLRSAMNSLGKLDLIGKIEIIGIAKRLEEIYKPGDPLPLYIDKKSESLKIIQQLRDEAHRFGITHHRNQRSKGTIKTVLTEIAGIGESTAVVLLRKFRSVKNIETTPLQEFEKAIGKAKGEIVWNYFNKK